MSDGQTLSSVRNALRLLKRFSADEPVLGVSDLARQLNVAKSTTHRLLSTLASEGFVRRTDDGRYALGVTLWELGSQMVAGLELRDVAHPVLARLRDETGETVHLAILDRHEVVYVDRFESQATLRLFRRIGFRMPAHATSTGKAILAFSSSAALDEVLEAGLPKLGPGTITQKRQLREALDRIRAQGYVLSVDESERGVKSVGAPVFDHSGMCVGAVSVAGPSQRMPAAQIPRFVKLVRGAADQISLGLGYSPRRRVAR